MSSFSRSSRSSISPFRSRGSGAAERRRPSTPSSSFSSRPASASGRPSTPSSLSGGGRPVTPSSVSSRPASSRGNRSSNPASSPLPVAPPEPVNVKENIMVTVRFRPLSPREISKGDELAWYADGDFTVRNECNQSIAYSYDRVFGPATTTRQVYDVAAQHVVSGAMEGINGTVFAYGVTSSGKTHTMHGEQKSPGIIPLAVKDVFRIIQDTPGREFLLRVSYLEIYNEVINDLLDPTGQNLRIREDPQGIYVDGIKEEVVLSPAHALSLIATGEEHRHVGSNNFNMVSSRSHTIFTMTIESSPGENDDDEEVRLSQLNLIDLAGSESSKTETTGLRRKEGSYINKSLLTLGTVIAKLTDGKAAHIPFRDSKLTRLLQSSLSGRGRISLICTVTPASSNSEETHNTLKFAQRSKNVEVQASQNKILDEKSLIKKYQKEISCLREELQHLRSRMMGNPYIVTSQEDLANLKLELEAGQVKLQSRLEEEEEAKAALLGRIQRLTKLILVSTKNSMSPTFAEKSGLRRRHSFGEDELAYLPDRKREYLLDEDAVSLDSDFSMESRLDAHNLDDSIRLDRRNRKRSMLGWFKQKKQSNADSDSNGSGASSCSQKLQHKKFSLDLKDGRSNSEDRKVDNTTPLVDSVPDRTQAGDLFSVTTKGRYIIPMGTTIVDQIDLLHEQVKMLAGEVALSTSSLKRLSEQATNNPDNRQIQEQIEKLTKEISNKRSQINTLEQRMVGSLESTEASNDRELSQTLSKLASELSEQTFQLELISADNRILQDQLKTKASENIELLAIIDKLKEEISELSSIKSNVSNCANASPENSDCTPPCTVGQSHANLSEENEKAMKSQIFKQASEIERLKQDNLRLTEEIDSLDIHSQKLAEELSYAKELATEAAVEIDKLAKEVTRLSYENSQLFTELAAVNDNKRNNVKLQEQESRIFVEELQKELIDSCQREAELETLLFEKSQIERQLLKSLDDANDREMLLKNELANMQVLVSKMRERNASETQCEWPFALDLSSTQSLSHNSDSLNNRRLTGDRIPDYWELGTVEEAIAAYNYERERCQKLERTISRLKGEDLSGLDDRGLEELQKFHFEAWSRIGREKGHVESRTSFGAVELYAIL